MPYDPSMIGAMYPMPGLGWTPTPPIIPPMPTVLLLQRPSELVYTRQRFGNITRVTVTSQEGGTLFYHWYVDGAWVGVTQTPSFDFYLANGEQAEIICQTTHDPAYDGPAHAPPGYPARRTLWWTKSADADVDHYRAEQGTGASPPGAWTLLGTRKDKGQWTFQYITPRLTDLTWYWHRIVPVDLAGNLGTPIVFGPEYVVRKPDAPDFVLTFNNGTQRATFAAA